MGIFPVSDVVKVVLLFFGTAFPYYFQNISVTPVLRVYSEYSLYSLGFSSEERYFLSHMQGLITLRAMCAFVRDTVT